MKSFYVDELYSIIAEVFDIKTASVRDDLGPNDVPGWDSLGQLKLVAELEARYRIIFETTEIFEIFTVGDIKRLLAKKGIK